ncbi:endoglucanase-like [Hibiscus syriacus]|uniref:Endoglucanase-like n=1 Tax=Hibiscus syriacus TaxID=106335 RepID=A0A6A2XB99_HIBSY|nr:protein LURP-one-related 17-like [Hibiscus syriacus]KAE8672488.1 endoglucanase-like [Hibiscus syriacus]
MFLFRNSLSRSVHDGHQEHPELSKTQGGDLCTSLTVWRKSLIVSCKGFTVIDSDGNLVYRVDTYMGGRPKELLLMDGSGKPIFTMRRHKKLRPVDTWLVYGGEVGELCTSEEPIFYVKKSINILHAKPNVVAYVYRRSRDKRHAYTIEGLYSQRSCKVVDENKRVVAEIRPKDSLNGCIPFGLEVFVLIVQAGLDPGFAMALVLLLDQMFS